MHGERVRAVLFYSSAYLAVIAAAEVLLVQLLLSLPPSPAPLVVGLVTFAVYANDRLAEPESDALSNPDRTAFVRRHGRLLYVLAALAYGLAVALSVLGGPVAFALALLPGVAWLGYAVGWDPIERSSVGRIKEVLFVNSVLVAAAWSLTVVCLPVAFADAGFGPATGVLVAYFLLATFVNAEVANAGDVETDREIGAATLPVVLGVGRARQVLYGVTLVVAGVLGAAVAVGYLRTGTALALAVGLVSLAAVVGCLGRTDRNGLLTVAAECTRLPVLAVVVILALT
ncbi:MAG: UbiA family prenyltransferase [Salinirussus sp.]